MLPDGGQRDDSVIRRFRNRIEQIAVQFVFSEINRRPKEKTAQAEKGEENEKIRNGFLEGTGQDSERFDVLKNPIKFENANKTKKTQNAQCVIRSNGDSVVETGEIDQQDQIIRNWKRDNAKVFRRDETFLPMARKSIQLRNERMNSRNDGHEISRRRNSMVKNPMQID